MKKQYNSVDEMYQDRVKTLIYLIYVFSFPATIISFFIFMQNSSTGIESGAGFWRMSFFLWLIVLILFSLSVKRINTVEKRNEELAKEVEKKRRENLLMNKDV